jgi:hypothetical protein
MTEEFNNSASQEERRRVLRESTRLGHAEANADDEAGGRFAKLNRPAVVGASPVSQYPWQPEESPWAADPVGPEPPLGVDVNEVPE